MKEDADTQLAVKFQHIDVTIHFSTIQDIFPPDKAFETFVTELLTAFGVIKKLRDISKKTISLDQSQEVDELLYKVVSVTADYYLPIRTYSIECADLQSEVKNHPAEKITQEIRTKIEFEESWGPSVRELGAPISSLKGYIELLHKFPLSEERRNEYLSIFDKVVVMVLAILTAYEKHLNGEIDLQKYQGEKFFELLDQTMAEDNQHNLQSQEAG